MGLCILPEIILLLSGSNGILVEDKRFIHFEEKPEYIKWNFNQAHYITPSCLMNIDLESKMKKGMTCHEPQVLEY